MRDLIKTNPALRRHHRLRRSLGDRAAGRVAKRQTERFAGVEPKGSPDIAEFTPKALAAFAGLSPSEHSSGSSVRRPGKMSRIGSDRLRGTLHMCAPSAKRTNKALTGLVSRMAAAGKPPKVIPIAVARKLLVFAHAVIRTQKPFDPSPDAPKAA